VTNLEDGFDASARSLTRRLIEVCEQDPLGSIDSRRRSAGRTVALLIATVAVVAGAGLAGASILHGKTSQSPSVSPTLPIAVRPTPSSVPTPTASAHPTPSGSGDVVINSLAMFSPTNGWAQRQSDGAVLRTTDGAQQWFVTMPDIGRADVIAAAFVNTDVARLLTAIPPSSIAVTSETVQAWATGNGGVTWTREGNFTGDGVPADLPAGSLDFVDPENGWFSLSEGAGGSSTMDVYRTQNAGASWTHVVATSFMPAAGQTSDIPLSCDKNPAVFSDASTGWITAGCAGGPAFLYVSHDGGVSWRPQSLGNTSSEYGYSTYPPLFVSPSLGYMIGVKGTRTSSTVVLFATTDGGQTWLERKTPETLLIASTFTAATDGWVAMNPPNTSSLDTSLWSTTDAGLTWVDLGLQPDLSGIRLDFLTAQIGWAYPSAIQQTPPAPLFRTSDGGRTWSPITPTIVEP
jgi:photosystem II stability/assembly factor-like uncharacterized protein